MVHIKIADISVSRGQVVSSQTKSVMHTAEKEYRSTSTALSENKCKKQGSKHNWHNTILLSLDAIQDLFLKTDLSGADMDMIVLSSQLPEYVSPATSAKIHNVIGGKKECICYDVNSNGCGMTLAFDQISKYMTMSPHIKRALLIGCDYMNIDTQNQGDAACAVLLEKTDEESGVCDALSIVSPDDTDSPLFPHCGFSNMFLIKDGNDMEFSIYKKKIFNVEALEESISAILSRNSLTIEKINMFCFSQNSKEGLEVIRERMVIDKSASPYIGDVYGDTGTSSPFIALYEAMEKQLIRRGDYFMICAFGCSAQNITLLCRF